MKTSENGLNLIKEFEGCKLKAYKCPAGVWTIGYGHTNNVRPDDKITKEEALELLLRDVFNCEGVINRLVKKNLTQGQYDALASFIFNLGVKKFMTSTLLRKINQGDFEGASQQFKRWVYGGGKKLPGLVRRRAAEEKLFNS